jgi:FKBP-type peptidyl-prolyl cis-trans isomerase
MGRIKGIEITDLSVGTGTEATQDNCVAVNVRFFLRRGDEVFFSPAFGPRLLIALWRRDCVAGLLKGIPGMRVGGLRQIVISPHLAYGETGIPGRIPANALLRCEVELVAIREHTALLSEDYLPGKLFRFTKPNIQNYRLPSWTFEMHENGNSMLVFPVRGSTPVRWFQASIVLDPARAASIIQLALDEPRHLPNECIQWDSGRLQIPTRGGLPVREKVTQAPCIVVNISERNERILDYAVPETSENFPHSPLFQLLSELVTPHLSPPTESSSQS